MPAGAHREVEPEICVQRGRWHALQDGSGHAGYLKPNALLLERVNKSCERKNCSCIRHRSSGVADRLRANRTFSSALRVLTLSSWHKMERIAFRMTAKLTCAFRQVKVTEQALTSAPSLAQLKARRAKDGRMTFADTFHELGCRWGVGLACALLIERLLHKPRRCAKNIAHPSSFMVSC